MDADRYGRMLAFIIVHVPGGERGARARAVLVEAVLERRPAAVVAARHGLTARQVQRLVKRFRARLADAARVAGGAGAGTKVGMERGRR